MLEELDTTFSDPNGLVASSTWQDAGDAQFRAARGVPEWGRDEVYEVPAIDWFAA